MSGLAPDLLLEEGAVLPTAAAESTSAIARKYSNPMLGDRILVRIIPEALGTAEDAALETLGFEPAGSAPVGHVRHQAVGFPAWPIMLDPANAHHALAIVGDLERVRRLARRSKGQAKAKIDDLASRLGASAPHFLPTFLEEAARIFLVAESPTYAAQYFGKAREAETTYALAVDEQRHRLAFVEFSLAGAVSAKSLGAESRRLQAAFEPQEALDRFTELVFQRVSGGLPPHAGVAKEVRRLAAAAGQKDAPLIDLVGRLLALPAIRRATAPVWESLAAPATAAAANRSELREILLRFIPFEVDIDAWIDILRAAGAVDLLRDGDSELLATWIEHLMAKFGRYTWGSRPDSAGVIALLSTLPLRSIRRPVEMRVASYINRPDVVDALLTGGVEPVLGETPAVLSVREWLDSGSGRDLAAIAAHPVLRQEFVRASDPRARRDRDVTAAEADRILAHPSVLAMLRDAVEQVLPIDGRPLNAPASAELRGAVSGLFHPGLIEALDLPARIASFTAENLVAQHLRTGLAAEFAWPAWERLCAEEAEYVRRLPQLYGRDQGPGRIFECWPYLGLVVGDQVVMVDGEHEVLRHRVAFTGSGEPRDAIQAVVESHGKWAIVHRTPDYSMSAYWTDAPGRAVDVRDEGTSISRWGGRISLPGPQGRIFGIGRILVPGNPICKLEGADVLGDGDRRWVRKPGKYYGTAGAIVEVDGAGTPSGGGLPAWVERLQAELPSRFELRPGTLAQLPVPNASVVSAVSKQRGSATWRAHRADGVVAEWGGARVGLGDFSAPGALLDRPGGGLWRSYDGNLTDHQTDFEVQRDGARRIPDHYWLHMRVRHPASSARMREATPRAVRALVEAATVGETSQPELRAVGRLLPGVPTELAVAVIRSARECAREAYEWAALVAPKVEARREPWQWEDASSDAALAPLVHLPYYGCAGDEANLFVRRRNDLLGTMALVARMLGRYGSRPDEDEANPGDLALLQPLIHAPAAVLVLAGMAGMAGVDDDGRRRLLDLSRLQRALGLVDDALWTGTAEWSGARTSAWLNPDTVGNRWYSQGAVIGDGDPGLAPGLEMPSVRRSVGPLDATFDAVIEAVAEHEEIPLRTDELAEFAAATGLTGTSTAILLGSSLGTRCGGPKDAVDATRDRLGITATELKAALTDLERYSPRARFAALALSVPSPVASWWLDDDASAAARRAALARAAAALTEEVPASRLSPDLRVRAKRDFGHRASVVESLAAVTSDDQMADLLESLRPTSAYYSGYEPNPDALWLGLQWFDDVLPADHPVRADLPRLADHLARALRAPGRVLSSVVVGEDELPAALAVMGLSGVDPQRDGQYESGAFRLTVAIQGDYRYYSVTVQPALLGADGTATLGALLAAVDRQGWQGIRLATDLALLRGHMADRVSRFEPQHDEPGDLRDPRFAAPEIVGAVAEELGLGEDAAVYYLQLLTLPRPTDAEIKQANGWTPARLKKAAAELVDKNLALTAKRARASRSTFLPGAWVDLRYRRGYPMEAWKLPFVGIAHYGRRTADVTAEVPIRAAGAGAAFRWAWRRYSAGDRPEFVTLDVALEER